MILALVICYLSVLVSANPFHRYPFVFLLDVGNEELEKINTEQIRLSTPGGSVALRYPAIGDGETIGHVRVSGIDFGTDLKANIVDGGPGYKYVVVVLMGNTGVPYDVVLTVQTVKDKVFEIKNVVNTNIYGDTQTEVGVNDSDEDDRGGSGGNDNGTSQTQNNIETNSEQMQSSSNVYNYAQSDVNDENDNPGDTIANEEQYTAESQGYNSYEVSEDEGEQKDVQVHYGDGIDDDEQDIQVKGLDDDDSDDVGGSLNDGESDPENDGPNSDAGFDNEETNYNEEFDEEEIDIKAEKYSLDDDNAPISVVDSNLYSKYEALKPHLYDGAVYSQDDLPQNKVFPQDGLDYEDPGELEQAFNDVDVHDDGEKYQDSNNNDYVDSDDGSAVAY